jgi:hypothetical protein
MALQKCPECGHQISTEAPACPGCGLISSTINITTQRTSKALKAQLFISAFLFWFGLLSWFLPYGGALDSTAGLPWSVTAMIIGGVWYMITKVLIWWHHE